MSRMSDARVNLKEKEQILNALNDFKNEEFNSVEHFTHTLRANGIPLKESENQYELLTSTLSGETQFKIMLQDDNGKVHIKEIYSREKQ